jgi:hypothetical protein
MRVDGSTSDEDDGEQQGSGVDANNEWADDYNLWSDQENDASTSTNTNTNTGISLSAQHARRLQQQQDILDSIAGTSRASRTAPGAPTPTLDDVEVSVELFEVNVRIRNEDTSYTTLAVKCWDAKMSATDLADEVSAAYHTLHGLRPQVARLVLENGCSIEDDQTARYSVSDQSGWFKDAVRSRACCQLPKAANV